MKTTDRQPVAETPRVRPWPDVAVAVYSAAFFVALAIPGLSTSTRDLVGILFFLPPGLAVAWMNWRTARLWPWDRETKRAWSWLAVSTLVYWLSGTVWSALLAYAPALGNSTWVESLGLVNYPLALFAILNFPGVYRDGSSRGRFRLDLALILVGCALGSWYFSFLPAVSTQNASGALLTRFLYPTAQLIVMLVTGVALLRATNSITRRALAWMFAGLVFRMSASVSYTLLRYKGGYNSGHPIDALWFVAWICLWTAARLPQYRLGNGAALEREQAGRYRSGALPVLSVLFAQGLLLWMLRDELQLSTGYVAIATSLLGALITRLRESERKQEARFRSLVQQGSDVLLVVGEGGKLLYRSPSAERLVSRAADEDEAASLAALFDQPDSAALEALLERVRSAPAAGPVSAHARGAGGKVVHLEFLATDLRADPAVGGVLLTGRDVTERHQLEQELIRSQSLRAIGQMAGGVAHDFNNILFVLRGNVELLLEDLPPASLARAEAIEIGHAADRAAAVTRKLLQFSRREVVRPVTVDLNAVLGDLEPVLRQFASSGIEIRFEYAAAPAQVVIDRAQIEQVVLNLSMNARDAMAGGGLLKIRTGHTGGDVLLEIEDNGAGMDEATRARLFEPFFTTKPPGEGIGLGLATVHGIVTNAGGRVQVETVQSRGTLFTVFLPRSPAPFAQVGTA